MSYTSVVFVVVGFIRIMVCVGLFVPPGGLEVAAPDTEAEQESNQGDGAEDTERHGLAFGPDARCEGEKPAG